MLDNDKSINIETQELNKDTLSEVTGGSSKFDYPEDDPSFDSQFRFKVGESVEIITGRSMVSEHVYTDNCTITHRRFGRYGEREYLTTGITGGGLINDNTWIEEKRFE